MKSQTLLDLNPETFHPLKISPVRHQLAGHPLLTLPKLKELALRLQAAGRVRYHSAQIPVSESFETAAQKHQTGLTLEQTLDQMEKAGSWVFLQNIQTDPVYKPLVDAALEQIRPRVEGFDPGMRDFAGWIFISSPGAVTPYHMDHNQTFLLQVAGNKTVNVWDPNDKTVIGERELETFHACYSLRETRFKDEYQAKAEVHEIEPGMGVFMPFTAPHWVKNGNAISITFSLTFLTQASRKLEVVYTANHMLRRAGLAPTPVGRSRARDGMKDLVFGAYLGAKNRLSGKPKIYA